MANPQQDAIKRQEQIEEDEFEEFEVEGARRSREAGTALSDAAG